MANNYTIYARDLMLDSLPSTIHLSLHSADPGETGANVTPGTIRAAMTLEPASGGVRLTTEDFVDIDVAQGETVAYVGVWDAATGGNLLAYVQVTEVVFAQNSVYRVTDVALDLNLVCQV